METDFIKTKFFFGCLCKNISIILLDYNMGFVEKTFKIFQLYDVCANNHGSLCYRGHMFIWLLQLSFKVILKDTFMSIKFDITPPPPLLTLWLVHKTFTFAVTNIECMAGFYLPTVHWILLMITDGIYFCSSFFFCLAISLAQCTSEQHFWNCWRIFKT